MSRNAGFTLLELLVVLIILGLISAFAVPRVLDYLDGAKTKAARVQIDKLATVLDLYRLDTGRYPSADEGLEALLIRPVAARGWNGPYVAREDMLTDPWGRRYEYRHPGDNGAYDLFTLGADGAEGGEGADRDVTSW